MPDNLRSPHNSLAAEADQTPDVSFPGVVNAGYADPISILGEQ